MRYVVLGMFIAIAGAAAQEMIPGTARPLIENMPANTSGYICPMHPNEVKAEPGWGVGSSRPNLVPVIASAVPAGSTDVLLEAEEGLRITGTVVRGDGTPVQEGWYNARQVLPAGDTSVAVNVNGPIFGVNDCGSPLYATLMWQLALLGGALSLLFSGSGALAIDRALFTSY